MNVYIQHTAGYLICQLSITS